MFFYPGWSSVHLHTVNSCSHRWGSGYFWWYDSFLNLLLGRSLEPKLLRFSQKMFNNKITGGSIEVGSTMTNNAGIPVVDDFDLHF